MSVTFEEYRQFVLSRVRLKEPYISGTFWGDKELLALVGLSGEVGEVYGVLRNFSRPEFLLEMGDVLWYFTLMLDVHSFDFKEEIANRKDTLFSGGLVESAGRISEWHKKNLFHKKKKPRSELQIELVNFFRNFKFLLNIYEFTLEEVMEANITKLTERDKNESAKS